MLAYGDLKRVELAIALAGDAAAAADGRADRRHGAAERGALMALARALARERGLAVLFTEHDMDVVFGAADRMLVLDRGALIAEGEPAAVRAEPRVRDVYLGGSDVMLSVERRQYLLWPRACAARRRFRVARGEMLVLLGRNGAGKSTTLKTLIGLVRPASGGSCFDGARHHGGSRTASRGWASATCPRNGGSSPS